MNIKRSFILLALLLALLSTCSNVVNAQQVESRELTTYEIKQFDKKPKLKDKLKVEGEWFVTSTFEYQLDGLSDPIVRKGCHQIITGDQTTSWCNGDNPAAEFKIGYEFSFGDWRSENKNHIPIIQIGWKHRSHWFNGWPFNRKGETHSEALYLEFKWGGLR